MEKENAQPSEFDFGMIFIWIWLLVVILVPILPARAAGPCYPVVRVVDGDTLSILYQGKKEKIRLLNVDTPESVHPNRSRNTPLGKKASAYTRSRLAGKRVCLEFEGKKRGKYGRLLAYVILDNKNFNLELVKKGWSPYYTKYGTSPSYHTQFTTAQSEARFREINFWNPDNFQEAKKGAKKKKSHPRIAVIGNFHGNTKSRVFHTPACRYYNCKHCTRDFASQDAALRAGFSPCGNCRP